jgi:hypothetical protein
MAERSIRTTEPGAPPKEHAMRSFSAAAEADYVRKRIEALQPVVSEPVIGVLALSRRGLYTEKFLGRLGFLAWAPV